ncbi:LytR family transcriptional regulator [Brevibacillus nitrificans]|uniref:LytR family transcriptional regulator n=1 Tax=Brevibacillus nitrificans TaxID=651560 RepID=A0A3M8D843_9BACL|nr:LCP family protein [Brevibacillus nitrificans]RNB84194.1 LytR family transcriptional regulator [Brevibacillus nitrificans]
MMLFSFMRKHGKKIAFHTISCLLIGALVAVAYTAYQYKQMTQKWYAPIEEKNGNSTQASASLPPRDFLAGTEPMKPFLMLLLGVDSRDGESARSDTIMLAAIHPAKQGAYLLSIPRDSYMELSGKGYDKVNHAMAFGGPKMVKESLEKFLQVKIDRYMSVDFDGFRQIVDELGGVSVDVKKRMKYSDPSDDTYIDIKPGLQTLSGEQALDYARYRKSDLGKEDSDYQRINRQQEIVRALASKGSTVQAYAKAFSLMEIVGNHVKTDLTEGEIASLLISYGDPTPNAIHTDTLIGQDERIWHNGILGWYHLVPSSERERVRQQIVQAMTP